MAGFCLQTPRFVEVGWASKHWPGQHPAKQPSRPIRAGLCTGGQIFKEKLGRQALAGPGHTAFQAHNWASYLALYLASYEFALGMPHTQYMH